MNASRKRTRRKLPLVRIKIQSGIPISEGKPGTRRRFNVVYPVQDMNVGDSFLYQGPTIYHAQRYLVTWAKKTGFKFAARTMDGKVRVWRTA